MYHSRKYSGFEDISKQGRSFFELINDNLSITYTIAIPFILNLALFFCLYNMELNSDLR